MSDDATRPNGHRAFLLLVGGIGVLLVLAQGDESPMGDASTAAGRETD